MILSDVKHYLREHRQVPIADLVNRFDVPADALRGMLDVWIRKGKVRRDAPAEVCGGCTKCAASALEFYEWVA